VWLEVGVGVFVTVSVTVGTGVGEVEGDVVSLGDGVGFALWWR
jgi:hypothetical protein